jgi:polyisoprenoid-binding protein YceI
MTYRRFVHASITTSFVLGLFAAALAAGTPQAPAPLTIGSGRLTITGTSSVHDWTATTSAVRITRAQLASPAAGQSLWDEAVKTGTLEAFEIAVATGTLKSGKDGLDKNMYKALNTTQHPDVTFRLVRMESGAAAGALKAVGMLTIAGVQREVALDLTTQPKDATLVVKGSLPLVMTDYGIKPPKAMLGVIKTNPKVTVTFEIVLAPANTPAAR